MKILKCTLSVAVGLYISAASAKNETPEEFGQWFDTNIRRYEQIPRDFRYCENSTVTNIDDSLYVNGTGKLEIDGDMEISVLTNRMANRFMYKKQITCCVEGGKKLVAQSFEETSQQYYDSIGEDTEKTAACSLFAEDGVTNLAGLVRDGSTNAFVRLSLKNQLDLSEKAVFTMTIEKYDRDTFVTYQVNGIPAEYNGLIKLPVVTYEEQNKLRLSGYAVATDIYGDLIEIPTGHKMTVK